MAEERRYYRKPGRDKIDNILIDVQRKLRDSYESIALSDLNAFERKRIHRFFDDKEDFTTKTYRTGDEFTLRIYPVGNLKKFAESKAQEAFDTGKVVALPPMSNFERYIIHDHLQSMEGIETTSVGESSERHIEIHPVRFGRGLRRIIKKIKLL